MRNYRKLTGLFTAALLTFGTLTGCTSSQDKQAISDTATAFLSIVASDSTEDITNYATTEVAEGDFVKLFDADYLAEQIVSETEGIELTNESKEKVDEFCGLYSDMIQSYSISDVNFEEGNNNKATCLATIKTKFDVNITDSDTVSEKINQATENYNTENAEEIAKLSEEDPDAANAQVFNDMLILILNVYEEEIASSEEMTYAMVLTLEKNTETDSWIVTNVEDYDSSDMGN